MTTPTPLPSIISLDHAGRMHLLSALEMSTLLGVPVDADVWRDAWGKAADYQTAQVVRAELAMVERGAA